MLREDSTRNGNVKAKALTGQCMDTPNCNGVKEGRESVLNGGNGEPFSKLHSCSGPTIFQLVKF